MQVCVCERDELIGRRIIDLLLAASKGKTNCLGQAALERRVHV